MNNFEEYRLKLESLSNEGILHSSSESLRDLFKHVADFQPLLSFIPLEYGGIGNCPKAYLKTLEITSYYHLPLSLAIALNGALFLQPVAKYASKELKEKVLSSFVNTTRLGGIMITEPSHGSDALNIQTSFTRKAEGYFVEGTKHWSGQTGEADYWLILAREVRKGKLVRDLDFFLADNSIHRKGIRVDSYYQALGLKPISYGKTHIQLSLSEDYRLKSSGSGLRMLSEIFQGSRFTFAGMGSGFLKRIVDEAVKHACKRSIGGKPLFSYDQARKRIAELQALHVCGAAMCFFISKPETKKGEWEAKITKALATDYAHKASQSLMQLMGAKGYESQHFAARALVDSRPGQIFEGSNDILFHQIGETTVKRLKKTKQVNFLVYLQLTDWSNALEYLDVSLLNFDLLQQLPQRKLVDLGKIMSRVVVASWMLDLYDCGFEDALIKNALANLNCELAQLVASLHYSDNIQGFFEGSQANWHDYKVI